MTRPVVTLAMGLKVHYDGESYVVRGLAGTRITMRSARGRLIQVDAGELLAHPSTRLLVPQPEPDEGVGSIVSDLRPVAARNLDERLSHVREVLTGFRSGDPHNAAPGEPRPDYDPARPLMERYDAKAGELGVGQSTVRRWAQQLRDGGPAAMADGRGLRRLDPLRGVDQRWMDACSAVLDEHVEASRPTRQLILERVEARLDQRWGPAAFPRPPPKRARRALAELSRGTNAFTGSTKGKRSIADRPQGVYGRLRATRPGEYLLLDTTRLDVFAMEPLTLRWVGLELSIALDLYSRCLAGLRLSPVSTKAIDALPDVAPETLVVDHGKIYLSDHVESVCARLGISIQPARPHTPTDKAPAERFFRTLAEGLLAALPGYKGPDVYSRGTDIEKECYFFIDELEQIIRQWVAEVYHHRPHDGLVDPAVAVLRYSPAEMWASPRRPDGGYDA